MAGELEARIDPGSLRKLVQASRTWDKVSRAEMRKGLRASAAQGAEAAKREVLGPPPARLRGTGGQVGSTGMRAGLARGVKVAIKSGREARDGRVSGEGVRVTTTSSALPDDKAPMVKAYMAKTFRHPVFGKQAYATQRGKNWFYDPLFSGRAQYQAAIVQAIEAASKAIDSTS